MNWIQRVGILGLLPLLLGALWIYIWFQPEQYDRQLILPLTAGVERGINVFDERAVEQEFILSEAANEIRIRIQQEKREDITGELTAHIREKESQHTIWEGKKSLSDLVLDEAVFDLTSPQLRANTRYVLHISTEDIEHPDSIQIPYEFGDDSAYQEGTVTILEQSGEGAWNIANSQGGNIAIQFYRNRVPENHAEQVRNIFILPAVLISIAWLAFLFIPNKKSDTEATFTLPPRRELLLVLGLGVVLSTLATLPLYRHPTYISNHGDVNRALVFSGLAREQILQGRLPLWNPYFCGGSPLFSDIEFWSLQPFFLLTLPFSEVLALKISYTLTLFTAFVGFAFLARSVFGFRLPGTLAFALLIAFGAYISQHLAEGYFVWVGSAWIPWFLLAAITSLRNRRYVPLAALMLVFMFGSGTMHMAVYSLLFFGLYITFHKNFLGLPRRFSVAALIVAFFLILSAVKLIPVMTSLDVSESRIGFTPPLSLLPDILLARGTLPALIYNQTAYRWSEFGNYIGYLGVSLALLGMFAYRRIWSQKHVGLLYASLIMGIIAFMPIPVTQGVLSTVVDLFRMPSRVMIFPLIGVGLLAAHGIELIQRKITFNTRAAQASIVILLTVFAIDLVSNDWLLFANTFNIPIPPLQKEEQFVRRLSSHTTEDEKYYRAGYINYLKNEGTNDLCRFYQQDPQTRGHNTANQLEPYQGEAYLANQSTVQITKLDPGNISLRIDTPEITWLHLNQNYYPGWKAAGKTTVEDKRGLVSLIVPEGEREISLYYYPDIIPWSALISLLGIILGVGWFYIFKKS